MMPAFRTMDSYPYQRNQTPLPHGYYYYYPGIVESNHPQMKIDPPKQPFPYEQPPCPYGGGGCGGYSFCCGHNNFPGYYSPKPCYHHPHYHHHASIPSPTMYYSGGYNHHHQPTAYGEQPFFVPYSPQPHYTMDLPRYEYDKYDAPRDYHCCGCHNHLCHQKEAAKGMKIEEEEPDAGEKVKDDALGPVRRSNYPYPIVWIPPEYTRKNIGVKDHPAAADGHEPRVWNGWLPFGAKGAPNIVNEGDRRRIESENSSRRESEDEHKRSEFPFPIIWMPYYNKQEEGGMENNQEKASTPKRIEEVPNSFKPFPVNSKADGGVTSGIRSSQVEESTDKSGSDATKKVTNEKIIPVKEMGSESKNDWGRGDKREKIIPVKQMEDNGTKKDSDASAEKQSASLRKTSKLPPVCLRVDPLPRKKDGNGSSRSPSPPASKGNSQAKTSGTSKVPSGGVNDKAQPNSNAKNAPKTSEEVKPKEGTIQVCEEKTNGSSRLSSPPASEEHSQSKTAEASNISSGSVNDQSWPDSGPHNAQNISEEVKPKKRTIQVMENKTNENNSIGTKESCSVSDNEEAKEEKGEENMKEEAAELKEAKDLSEPTDEGRKMEKVLSDVDAAVLIQAAYRGYHVRRWEPLKKLKQIGEVGKELNDVRGIIEAFEQSSDLQNDEKQRIAIGETIMRLLLKLDTIQGLDSSFREVRKSLARELTSLQERLDSVVAKKPQHRANELAEMEPVEDTSTNAQNDDRVQEKHEENAVVPKEDSSEGIRLDMVEECEDQSCLKEGINSVAAAVDSGSEAQSQEHIAAPNETVGEVPEIDKMVVEPEAESEAKNIAVEVDNLDVNAWNELPVGVIDEEVTDHSSKKDERNEKEREEVQLKGIAQAMVHDSVCDVENSDILPMTELPVGLLDEDATKSQFESDDWTQISKGEPQDENEESIVELPVRLFDEETVKAETEKHDEPVTSKELPPSENEVCNAGEKVSPCIDVTAKDIQLEQQEEVPSSGESDGWVQIEFQNENKTKGDASMDIADKCGEETGNCAEFPPLTVQANVFSKNDSHREDEQEEKVSKQEAQFEGQDILAEQAISANAGNEHTNEGTETMDKEKKTELSASSSSPALSEVTDVAEHDGGHVGDTKLLEENERLRELMEKLLEAGNEQVNVISDLTGRVKDLEKRLARNKRVKTKRFRSTTSKIRSNNNPLQDRAIGVAM